MYLSRAGWDPSPSHARFSTLAQSMTSMTSISALVDELERLARVHQPISAPLGARLVALGKQMQPQSAVSTPYLEMLPDTLAAYMLSFLKVPEMAIASRTCRRMRARLADAVSTRAAALNLQPQVDSAFALHHAEVLKQVAMFDGPSTFAPPERAPALSLHHYSFIYEFVLPDGVPLRVLSAAAHPQGAPPGFSPSSSLSSPPIWNSFEVPIFNSFEAASFEAPSFEAASHFQGARYGWAFRTGEHGLGYYRDTPPLAAPPQTSDLRPHPQWNASADFTDEQNSKLCGMLSDMTGPLSVKCFVHKTMTDELQLIYTGSVEEVDGEEGLYDPAVRQFYTSQDDVSETILAHVRSDLLDLRTMHPFEGRVEQLVCLKVDGWVRPAGAKPDPTNTPGICLTLSRGVFDEPEYIGLEGLQELLGYYFK